MEQIKIGLTSFSKEWVCSFTSAPEFVSACGSHILEGDENREAKLTEVWQSTQVVTEKKTKK